MKEIPKITPEEDYRSSAIALQQARDNYDHKASNREHEKLYSAARKIRCQSTDGGKAFFESLLVHPMPYVRLCAAFNLIPFDPQLAREVYQLLASGPPGEVRLAAEMTLKEWRAGLLDPDWFMKA